MSESSSVAVTVERPRSAVVRTLSSLGVLAADYLSGVLSLIPAMGIFLILKQVRADIVGPPERIIDRGEFDLATAVFVVVLFLLALIPAVVANLALGKLTGFPLWARLTAGAILLFAPIIVDEFLTTGIRPMSGWFLTIIYGG